MIKSCPYLHLPVILKMKALTRYAKKRPKRIKALLNSFPESNDLEILHRVRLEIKKIKTLLRLIHYNNKSFKEHSAFIPFRTIFRACEKIREPKVLHTLVVKFTGVTDLPAPYSQSLIQQFTNKIPAHVRTVKRQEKKLLQEIEKVKFTTYKKYLRNKTKELKIALSTALSVQKLHAIRKLIKEIYYLLTITNKSKSIDPFFKLSDSLIGAWHDKSIVIEKMKRAVPPHTDLIKKLHQEKRADIANLKRLIKDFYH